MESTLTCPECKGKQKMEIPKNHCLHSFECKSCKKEIITKKGCCVFCDYGDAPCPTSKK